MTNEMVLLNFIAAVKAKTCPPGVKVNFLDGMSYREAELLRDILQNPNCPQEVTIEIKEENFYTDRLQILANALKSGRCPSKLTLVFTTAPYDRWNDNNRNTFVSQGVTILANALASGHCPRGLTIRIKRGKLEHRSIQQLAKALQSGLCPAGLTLDLSGNVFHNEETNALADALQSGNCPPGLTLILEGCSLNSGSVYPLVRALKSGKCPRWLTLNLQGNHIQDPGCDRLSDALESGQCPLGLKLILAQNQISAKGIQAFSLALTLGKCPEMLTLDLSHNAFGKDGYKALAVAVKSRQCPRGLTLNLENTREPVHLPAGAPVPDDEAELRAALEPQFCPPGFTLNGVDAQTAQRVAESNAGHKAASQEIFTLLCSLKRNGIVLPRDVTGTLAKWVYPVQTPPGINKGRDFIKYLAQHHSSKARDLPTNSVELLSMQVAIKTLVGKYQKLPIIFHRKRAADLIKRSELCTSTLALRTLLKDEEQRFFSPNRRSWGAFKQLEVPLKNRIRLSWGYFGTLQKAIKETNNIPEPLPRPGA